MKYLSVVLIVLILSCTTEKQVTIVGDTESPRIMFGVDKLSEALKDKHYVVNISSEIPTGKTNSVIVVSEKKIRQKKKVLK
ncbi:hypothetical protein [Thalassobellus suaedae]|uniref:Uncharacterized protein n=1 Tax=Thalassobellus suaedae TaxID=3074124 RepID=A0ABY9XU72_9FLAO|nr:hypothetical protein RHP51_01650 [Flavobacteriaceae bacterium HL-DH14]